MKKAIIGLVCSLFMSGSVLAAPVTLPNTFAAGDVASAADVLGNDQAMTAGINSIATEQINADAITKTKINADVAGTCLDQNADGSLELELGCIDGTYLDPTIDITTTGNISATDIAATGDMDVGGDLDVTGDFTVTGTFPPADIDFAVVPTLPSDDDRDNSCWGYKGNNAPSGLFPRISSSIGWTDFDCDSYYNGTIPSGEVLAIISADATIITNSVFVNVRPNGSVWTSTAYCEVIRGNASMSSVRGFYTVRTDSDHIFEYFGTITGVGNFSIYFLGYIPATPQ